MARTAVSNGCQAPGTRIAFHSPCTLQHGQRITGVVEYKDATPEQLQISEINSGLYAFDAEWLRLRIGEIEPSAVTGELYLPELIPLARQDGRAVVTLEVEDDGTLLGINDRSQLADAELDMRLRILEAHCAGHSLSAVAGKAFANAVPYVFQSPSGN
mgnify:CR=1 FL=1